MSAEVKNHGNYKSYKYEYEWSISKFKSYAVGYSTATPDLFLNVNGVNYTFKLIAYPHGYNERVENYLSVYCKRGSPVATWQAEEMLIQFTCAILDSKSNRIKEKTLKQRMSIETHLGWVSYCRRDFLLEDGDTILPKGSLTLIGNIEIFENKAIMNAETEVDDPYMNNSLSKMSNDMNQLLLDGDFSDVTLRVEGQSFPAHKAILSARSTVFKAMIRSPLQANSNEIFITDIKAAILKKLLHYIYSGNVVYNDMEETQELSYAADKYQMHDLKKICNKILMQNLDIDNAIDLLLFGHLHSDNDLKYTAVEFIAKYASVIKEKQEWVLLMRNYPEVANLVFKKSLEESQG